MNTQGSSSMEEGFEIIDEDEQMAAMMEESNKKSIELMKDNLEKYLKKNRSNSTFKLWIAESDPDSVRINPRLRYKDSIQRKIWNESDGIKLFELDQLPELTPKESHATCGWPSGPNITVGKAKKRKTRKIRKQKRKSRKVKKQKGRKTRRGRK